MEMSATIRRNRNDSAPNMAKRTAQQFGISYKNRVLGSYNHGGARSVIPAGGPPRFIGTYTLGNIIIGRPWNHVETCFKKVHRIILH